MASGDREARVTLVTVAEAVGVSPTTVSNAYNRPHKLTPELRERIFATARQLGYAGPDPAARSLRRGRTGSVGLLYGEALAYVFRDPGALDFLRGLAEGTAEHHAVLQLIAVPDAGEEGPSLLANALVDGLVVWSLSARDPLLDVARARGIPLVTHGSPRLPGVPFVGIDDRAAARALAEHVVARRHSDAAVIAFPYGPSRKARERDPAAPGRPAYRITRERLAGYLDAVPAPAGIREVAENSREEGRRAALALLRGDPRPTALLAMSDELALGALAAARELGLGVPGDVAVTGWDDMPGARAADPPLTTIRQSLHEQGRTCARLLAAGADELVHLASWELVPRASTGAV